MVWRLIKTFSDPQSFFRVFYPRKRNFPDKIEKKIDDFKVLPMILKFLTLKSSKCNQSIIVLKMIV